MSDMRGPVLVYDRIDVNRRNTLLLLPAFIGLLLPLAYGATQLVVPLLIVNYFWWAVRFPSGIGHPPSTDVSTMMVLLTLVIASCGAVFVYLGSQPFVRWMANGRRVGPRDEPLLRRTVENLCLGAGLTQPAIYVVESSAPNAFSTGRDPAHASLFVTRGLLRLLDERELAGVLAHELSHIGNGDTDLSSLLSAFVATMRLPSAAVALVPSEVLLPVLISAILVVPWFYYDAATLTLVMIFAGPLYVFFIAPAAGMFVRKTIAHQREFLADADAVLLTRDPEGLALALAKVSAATGLSVNAKAAMAHMYFVDPLPDSGSWWDRALPSHPPVEARVALLARMGDGISTQALSNATAAGSAYGDHQIAREAAPARASSGSDDEVTVPDTSFGLPGTQFRLTDAVTPLYAEPDGWSDVVKQLSSGTVVTFNELVGTFARVTIDCTVGYIPALAAVEQLSLK